MIKNKHDLIEDQTPRGSSMHVDIVQISNVRAGFLSGQSEWNSAQCTYFLLPVHITEIIISSALGINKTGPWHFSNCNTPNIENIGSC